MLTIPHHAWVPYPMPSCAWLRGQLELGEGGFLHWQVLVAFAKKKSLPAIRGLFGPHHAELSRSEAATDYVWKEETRVDGTQFEFGAKPIRRNASSDWDDIWTLATQGDIDGIPAQIRVQHYRTIRAISADYANPTAMERRCLVYWGPTGTGKSRTAWEEAGVGAYPKDPRTKWWCGYRNHENVVIDEYRGTIDVSHLLRWLDRYPVLVEVKGGSVVLKATKFWITSNLDPRLWYPDLDEETKLALLRRLEIKHFDKLYIKLELLLQQHQEY